MPVSIVKWGNSAALRLPKRELKALSLHIGDSVNLVQKGNTLVIEPCKPSLEELLAKVTAENRHSDQLSDSSDKELL